MSNSETSDEGENAVEQNIIDQLEKELTADDIIEVEVNEEKPKKPEKKKRKTAAKKNPPKRRQQKKKKKAEEEEDSDVEVIQPAKKIKMEPVSEEDEKEEVVPAPKKGKTDPNAWLKAPGLSAHNFGQCTDCQAIQKTLAEVVVQKKEGLTVRIVQCVDCFTANRKLRAFKWEQFSGQKLTPIGEYDFFAEPDDYKVSAAQYLTVTMQCGYCNSKQGKMKDSELIEKLDKKHVLVHLAQCSSCRFANKNMQKLFWDGFSSYKKGGKPAEKKEEKKKFDFGKKRKRQQAKEESSSSSSSSSEESSSSSSDEEPKKKKKK